MIAGNKPMAQLTFTIKKIYAFAEE